jgi:hypothetical protein
LPAQQPASAIIAPNPLNSAPRNSSTLAVSALAEDSSATGINGNQADNSAANSGAVYVFTRTATTWAQQAYLKASHTGADDRFGPRVALSANGSTLVVGASAEDSSATGVNGNQADSSAANSGAVYVFTRTATTWAQQAYLKASNAGADDQFGRSLALSGDGSTLAVGAPSEDSSASGVNGNQTDNSVSEARAKSQKRIVPATIPPPDVGAAPNEKLGIDASIAFA